MSTQTTDQPGGTDRSALDQEIQIVSQDAQQLIDIARAAREAISSATQKLQTLQAQVEQTNQQLQSPNPPQVVVAPTMDFTEEYGALAALDQKLRGETVADQQVSTPDVPLAQAPSPEASAPADPTQGGGTPSTTDQTATGGTPSSADSATADSGAGATAPSDPTQPAVAPSSSDSSASAPSTGGSPSDGGASPSGADGQQAPPATEPISVPLGDPGATQDASGSGDIVAGSVAPDAQTNTDPSTGDTLPAMAVSSDGGDQSQTQ